MSRPLPPPTPVYVASLDLGQANDYSALAVCEVIEKPALPAGARRPPDASPRNSRHFIFNKLHRWPLGTTYTQIVESVVRAFEGPPLAGSTLCVDATGVGRAVLDLLREASPKAFVRWISITGGAQVAPREDGRGYNVPKRDLAGVLHVLLGSNRIHVAPALPLAKVLLKELQTFSVKINIATGHDSYESLREGDHDDLVLAVAMACWLGEHTFLGAWDYQPSRSRSLMASAPGAERLDRSENRQNEWEGMPW